MCNSPTERPPIRAGIRVLDRSHQQDNVTVYHDLPGLTAGDLQALKEEGVV